MNILIVKLSSLGDVIQTIPVVHDLLQQFPDAHIDWVVEEAFAPLLARVHGLRRVLPVAQRRWRKSRWSATTRQERHAFKAQLQQQAYDVVIDFQGLIKSAWLARGARLAPGGFSATYGNRSEACGYEWPVRLLLQRALPMPTRIHAVARYRLLAGLALGYTPQGVAHYPIERPSAPPQASVVLAHGTTRADNEWPEADWVALGQRLAAQGLRSALPQSNATELARVTRIAQALDGWADVWPGMGLPEVMDRMAQSSGVIGVDSGLSHMAVALGLPHVQIFSQPRAWRAGPVGCTHQVAVGGEQAPDVDTVWLAWLAVRQAAGA
ncbi:lipopolysaccharide heptosyltransferase I [Rhodoferax lacus]|uniref:Lipopolysaccharide heptosyltransferase 1 n=1 Tax=Rhodoferax lacus TaxID=2184758 RepID=A0A3E1RFZ4_9BURK|nr:lipopolysaccharide heptosyltransferase I [Rhodoferax lacus]RFO98161.1 lipopolysaccharide heptosyltransferase I [Rhodoferax lacus]